MADMTTMEFALLAMVIALGWKIVDTVKFLQAKDWKSAETQVTAWAAGVGVIFLASASDWAVTEKINGQMLSDLNSASKVLVGMSILSVGSVVKDITRTNRSSDTPTDQGTDTQA